ncbi:hypothetical protein PZA11_000088 [Diplocarpon coronariae]|uniref:Uncharacterized protein n=1 Tax=Diplocarpon coronariae TaxID=2795749 RepID=A0A218ZEL8_9HELO|nr:hypothetical protein JHW43_007946 [Diplocarpon mali]OWP06467.1 hypothetical protein B2J93_9240 [Marssonina coronariae]
MQLAPLLVALGAAALVAAEQTCAQKLTYNPIRVQALYTCDGLSEAAKRDCRDKGYPAYIGPNNIINPESQLIAECDFYCCNE